MEIALKTNRQSDLLLISVFLIFTRISTSRYTYVQLVYNILHTRKFAGIIQIHYVYVKRNIGDLK